MTASKMAYPPNIVGEKQCVTKVSLIRVDKKYPDDLLLPARF